MTDIINGYPPIYSVAQATFQLTGREIFAWDGIIYNPGGGSVTEELIAHEEVHFKQQRAVGGPEKWWALYFKSPEFRLEQEIEAHRVEYRVFCRKEKDRNRRAVYLNLIANRLASPMYGNLIKPAEAKRRIKA